MRINPPPLGSMALHVKHRLCQMRRIGGPVAMAMHQLLLIEGH